MAVNSSPIVKLTAELLRENPQLRYGQALFNALHTLHPERANEIRGSRLDPFFLSIEKGSEIEFMFWEWFHKEEK